MGNADRLQKVLGFDAAQANAGSADAFKDALAEINEERRVEGKAKAKELLKKAMELRSKQDKARKEFEAAAAKFEKELGQLLKTIEAMANGNNTPPAQDKVEEL